MEFADVQNDLAEVLLTEEDIHGKIAEMARTIEADYAGGEAAARRCASWCRHGHGRPCS